MFIPLPSLDLPPYHPYLTPYPHLEIPFFIDDYTTLYSPPSETLPSQIHTTYQGTGKRLFGLSRANILHRMVISRLEQTIFPFAPNAKPLSLLRPDASVFIHQVGPGGFDSVHLDGSWLPGTELYLLFNAIYYVTIDWEPSWGGGTTLYSHDGSHLVKTIPFESNKLLIFLHDAYAWHGMDLVCAPPGIIREVVFMPFYGTKADCIALRDGLHLIGLDFPKWKQWSTRKGQPKAAVFSLFNRFFRRVS